MRRNEFLRPPVRRSCRETSPRYRQAQSTLLWPNERAVARHVSPRGFAVDPTLRARVDGGGWKSRPVRGKPVRFHRSTDIPRRGYGRRSALPRFVRPSAGSIGASPVGVDAGQSDANCQSTVDRRQRDCVCTSPPSRARDAMRSVHCVTICIRVRERQRRHSC
jgi:hypothetical protein